MARTPEELAAQREAIAAFVAEPWLAHRMFFPHRMPDGEADFHKDICDDFWFGARWKQILGFRGCGKSTIGESNIALQACYRRYKNLLIYGPSEIRAAERLAPVKYQLEQNDPLLMIFGQQRIAGNTWTDTKIVLASGYCIQAVGRDQDIRGLKHYDWRPDFIFVDDFEDKETVRTPEARRQTLARFVGELLPACEPNARVLVNGTVLDEESVPMLLKNQDHWPTRMIPIEHLDGSGERCASWPARFSLEWIDERKKTYSRLGQIYTWNAEYMMIARSSETTTFSREQFRYEEIARSWHATYAMIDPARTTNRDSASTGWAVWSWIAHRLVVWASGASLMMPDEIIDLIFAIDEEFSPVWTEVEPDGLEQFIMQPIRQEMVRRGITPSIRAARAGANIKKANAADKMGFIRGLQPHFAAREVIFVKPMPELEQQLLSFPTGRIDAPNALAQAILSRPGALIYDNFSEAHIANDLGSDPRGSLYLAANATRTSVSAVLVQFVHGQLRVLADWLREGEPSTLVADIYAEAALLAEGGYRDAPRSRVWTEALKQPVDRVQWRQQPLKWVTPLFHRDRWNNVGLNQAIAAIPATFVSGAAEGAGRVHLREQLERSVRGLPAVSVGRSCTWVLRAFAGGYSRFLARGGLLAEHAEEGPYRVLMEGLESFAGMMANPAQEEDVDNQPNYAFDKHGRRYLSAMPQR